MNRVIINGHLTKDMEVRIAGETPIANFTIANNNGFGEREYTSFINCTMFGEKRINALEKFLLKGCKVLIDGVWRQSSYENAEGKVIYTHELTVNDIEIEKFIEVEQTKKKTYSKKK